uniref:Secreted protein n=1 Tax=Macrostomum lignano TaxID=282301 RepID=A0A1I8F3E6_9PLAT
MLKKQLLIALAFLLAGIAVDSGAAILCYSRDQSTGVANGTVDDCPSDLACYLYTKDKLRRMRSLHRRKENTEDHNCESCTSDYCNDWPSLIGCFYAKSETKKENWLKISCNKKFCYSFNYTIGATWLILAFMEQVLYLVNGDNQPANSIGRHIIEGLLVRELADWRVLRPAGHRNRAGRALRLAVQFLENQAPDRLGTPGGDGPREWLRDCQRRQRRYWAQIEPQS